MLTRSKKKLHHPLPIRHKLPSRSEINVDSEYDYGSETESPTNKPTCLSSDELEQRGIKTDESIGNFKKVIAKWELGVGPYYKPEYNDEEDYDMFLLAPEGWYWKDCYVSYHLKDCIGSYIFNYIWCQLRRIP